MKEKAIDSWVIESFNKFLEFYEPANVDSVTDFFTDRGNYKGLRRFSSGNISG